MTVLSLPSRQAEIIADVDVCVAGAGPAGLGAALAAARQGATVCLLERHGFMGGNFTAASVGTVCGLYVREGGGFDFVVRGIAKELVDALMGSAQAMGPIPFQESAVLLYVPWAAKRLFDHTVSSEERITLFLHALVSEVVMDGDRIEAVVVASKRGPVAVKAGWFVDATGDADLVAWAGGEWVMGEPGRRQHASMQFVMEHVDGDTAMARGIPALASLIAERGHCLTRDGGALIPTFRPGEFIGAMTRVTAADGGPLDITDLAQATWGEIRGREIAEEAAQFVIDNVPGFDGSFLADTAPNLGVRESRRVVGEYVLTGDDVRGAARFDDAIAAGAWPLEYHVTGRSTQYQHLAPGEYYQVPLRSTVPHGATNLLVAGRCLSADPDALASIRVMAPSMAIGQAAGTWAAMASQDLAVTSSDLQDSLREQGAFLG